jgi:hypothetical protein
LCFGAQVLWESRGNTSFDDSSSHLPKGAEARVLLGKRLPLQETPKDSKMHRKLRIELLSRSKEQKTKGG